MTSNMDTEDIKYTALFKGFISTYKKAGRIVEYDFVVIESDAMLGDNFIIEDQRFGIAASCVKPLYSYVYKLFKHHMITSKDTYKECARHKQLCSGDKLKEDCKTTLHEMLDLTVGLLMVHADHVSAWNVRKRCVIEGLLSFEQELHFTQLIVQKHPKRSEIFIQRRWLFNYFHKNTQALLKDFAAKECQLCTDAAHKYPNNYYAWSHRIWVLQCMFPTYDSAFLCVELDNTKRFNEQHISDYSGFHYKLYVLELLTKCECSDTAQGSSIKRVLSELEDNKTAIEVYPNHEALWMFRRGLVAHILTHFTNCHIPLSSSLDGEITIASQLHSPFHKRIRVENDEKTCQNEASSSLLGVPLTTKPIITAGPSMTTGASVTTMPSMTIGASVTTGASLPTGHVVTSGASVTTMPSMTTGTSITTGASVTTMASVTTVASVTTGSSVTTGPSVTTGRSVTTGASVTTMPSMTTGPSVTTGPCVTTGDCVTTMPSMTTGASVTTAPCVTTGASVTTLPSMTTRVSATTMPSMTTGASVTTRPCVTTGASVKIGPSVTTGASMTTGSSMTSGSIVTIVSSESELDAPSVDNRQPTKDPNHGNFMSEEPIPLLTGSLILDKEIEFCQHIFNTEDSAWNKTLAERYIRWLEVQRVKIVRQ